MLIKASAGGGGKGMRVVADARASSPRARGAQARGEGAFGDDTVLVEQYLERPRHIEVQVFADTHGNTVHLFERDCSVQRRHQKVVEEAPAPGLTAERARAHGRGGGRGGAGRRLCRRRHGRVHRRRPDGERFYFMEMNTRLQVEHPVTEMITGLDLVEWQLRVAAGEPLPLRQDEIALSRPCDRGAALCRGPGARFSARDRHAASPAPARGAMRSGSIPACAQGDAVTPFYDPMIAKLIAWGEDRAAARAGWPARCRHRRARGRDQSRVPARVVAARISQPAKSIPALSSAIGRVAGAAGPAPALAAAAALRRLLSRGAAGRAAPLRRTRGPGGTAGGSISRRRLWIFCSSLADPNIGSRQSRSLRSMRLAMAGRFMLCAANRSRMG